MESVLAKEVLRVLFDSQMNMGQWCAAAVKKANLIRNSEAIRSGEVMVLWYVALVTTHPDIVFILVPSLQGGVLGLAGMLTLPAAAHTVLCPALVGRRSLVSQQCFVYCCPLLAQHQVLLQPPKSQQTGGV